MIYQSTYPDVVLSTATLWDFVFRKGAETEEERDKILYLEEDPGKGLKYSELKNRSISLARQLLNNGFKKGDTVVVFSENSVDFPVLIFAFLVSGIIGCPVNSMYQPEELAYQITDSKAVAVVASPKRLETAKAACRVSGLSIHNKLYVLADRDVDGIRCIKPSLEDLSKNQHLEQVSADDICLLCYSSGTSGLPKGVQLSHAGLTSAILQAIGMTPKSFTDKEVWIGVLPMAHMFGIFVHVLVAPYIRAKVVVFPEFHLQKFARAIDYYRVTTCHIVPPIAVHLIKGDVDPTAYNSSSLREWRSGAAPLGKDLQSLLEKRWGVPVHSWYGMSETSAIISISNVSNSPPPGAVGALAPNMTAKVLENGELCLKGPNIMLGYKDRPKFNAETIDSEGFMHTGDVVEIDDDGYIYVLDRVKELIKFNGYQVPPAELEDLLLKHEDIQDVAVTGLPDESRATEMPLAFVVLKDSFNHHDPKTLDMKRSEIHNYVAERVARHKQLRGGVVFVDKVPKSPSGKILRVKLREFLKNRWPLLSAEEKRLRIVV
ncbi:hypothetical protein AGABI1DRAFT_131074 [Agaricus bisporus var. burnettii JB137-S8]|uniref:Uncharacterized protein n=2 Tax=Agaricus bisporus var. burnettii TaxID=192524 RepID=K5X1J6_AGABU|nr:uncharacterized protein AGABI1DRAFT_131074 [Agaricus bisporus var. burnettii JB137-S8]EKM76782.1 hypothetical protein AGABI1DRAFT_131074 [Agaricus bisporus var. burnettii JB137-S8]KAF7763511.1 hypothetical protein Agabi119p4_8048 [Agaricus bisporus var. burnettii]